MNIVFGFIMCLARFTHGKPVRSRPERHVVLRLVLELLTRLQVMMNTRSKFWHVFPVVLCSAGRTGWLTTSIWDAGIKDMGKRVSTHIQLYILFEDMFASQVSTCIFRSIHVDLRRNKFPPLINVL